MNVLRRARFITLWLAAGSACLWAPADSAAAETASPGATATETRSLPAFQSITLDGSMNLLVRQGPQQVQVTAGDKQLPHLETVVENGKGGPTLVVRWKREPREGKWGWNWSSRGWNAAHRLLVSVTMPSLNAIHAEGSGDVVIERFETPALKLYLSGSGDAQLKELTTTELGVSLSGSGDVAGKGSAGRVTLSLTGSGDARLADLRADDVLVQIAGSGDALVNAQRSLKVSIAGTGDVVYTGSPTVKSAVDGTGSVRRR